ncbi:T9SS type A sorting domain-containing protein [Mangrovivirga cuniculi]|uniref:Secretion system C-terminal sorting domain-containing protein n=1 Tax=Mangrovivirga cuniculi TaxID=2715131 RepID=A0A4D7JWV8_9BACT|nr:T9SS type A sorting domain-containing protein [Mangrovivirga cuniculi]QCK15285.1 hypothetical protein DCC35_11270 [Mangrovivirga cuniculi]
MLRSIQFFTILFLSFNFVFSQDSKTNSFGYWHDPDSWDNGDVPGYIENEITFLEDDSVNIRGKITLNTDLDITNTSMYIHKNDTLVIQGSVNFLDSYMLNEGVIIINGNGLAANSKLSNKGKIVITGNFDGIDNTLEGATGISYVYGYSNSNVGNQGSATECEMNDPHLYHWVRAQMQLLPVELLSFDGLFVSDIYENYIELNWTTIDEKNHDGFMIQRSTNAETWIDIEWVSEKERIENGVNHYVYQDKQFNSQADRYYYRLKQVDLDGRFEIHDIIAVYINIVNTESLAYPVPFNDMLTLEVPPKSSISIYDQSMKKLKTRKNKTQRVKNVLLNTKSWRNGVYVVQIKNKNSTESVKIFKSGRSF